MPDRSIYWYIMGVNGWYIMAVNSWYIMGVKPWYIIACKVTLRISYKWMRAGLPRPYALRTHTDIHPHIPIPTRDQPPGERLAQYGLA